MAPRFAIGIDLGTSNSALASIDLENERAESCVFSIPQKDSPGTRSAFPGLPSFLYLPPDSSVWEAGVIARELAHEQPGRVVLSAKSWLCHPAVDRNAPLLPWQSEDLPVDQRLSPVDASACFLRHLREAWEAAHALPFADQLVAVTVPASFDAVAQELTREAIRRAGYPPSTLLMEEPQAAFYRWLERHGEDITPGTLLVVDIGGGTTDFSLFEVSPGHPPAIKRIAVGEHLLLGGDNIDRSIAEHFRKQFEQSGPALGARQWGFLIAQSRRLKEALLCPGTALPTEMILPAAGRSLFGEVRAVPVDAPRLISDILEGFFPDVDRDASPRRARSGLRELGLPYAADSAVTRHLAEFLRGRPPVDQLLCNGGTLLPLSLRERLCAQIARWQEGRAPELLDNPEPDLAVARGAAVYACRRFRGAGLMEAGAAHAVYLDIVDRKSRQSRHLCILPRGGRAGQTWVIDEHPLRVVVDTPVRFQAWSSARLAGERAGELLDLNPEELHPLPSMQTRIALPPGSPRAANNLVEVAIESSLSDLGALQVRLLSRDKAWKGNAAWELVFNLRGDGAEAPAATAAAPPAWEEAAEAIRAVFGKRGSDDPRAARHLFNELETRLRQPRREWGTRVCRTLWPALAEGIGRRQRSKDHEAAWLALAGYLLRPGFGADMDPLRIDELWRLHALGLAFPREARNRTQLWILWRRVAGGLDRARQLLLAETWLGPLASAGPVSAELIRLAGSLERVPAETKIIWIRNQLLRLPKAPRDEAAAIAWALGRQLSRIPFGGGPEDVLPASEAESAIEELHRADDNLWVLPELRQALLRMGRLTGIPGVDVSASTRQRLRERLATTGARAEELRVLEAVVPVDEAERESLFGETLPPGLIVGAAR